MIGTIQGVPVRAGVAGRAAALTLRGARVSVGQLVAVIDEDPAASMLEALARRAEQVARGVIATLSAGKGRETLVASAA